MAGMTTENQPAASSLTQRAFRLRTSGPTRPHRRDGNCRSQPDLSERRAATIQTYLRDHGVNANAITTTVRFGSSRPLAEERSPDGSDSVAGRSFNRRVEIVLRLPS
jgi:flagellar motor protein MotB